ncbi:MAG: helix-turn-helix transcriptional regulator [Gammaproteobacteria bacterium]|nr:helix-turn-helix transcriptional regulator [Gammaproteobacteria bacterium]
MFTTAAEVSALFDPIVQHTAIDYAGYGRIYADGGHFYLDNLVELQEYLLIQLQGSTVFDFQLLYAIANDSFFSHIGNKIIVFEQDIDSKNYWSRTSRLFDIEHLLYVFERFDDHFDLFAFASRSGVNLNSFYISNFDVLERFMLFFKEKNKEIINKAERNRIMLQKRNEQYYCIKSDICGKSSIQEFNKTDLHKMYRLDKYPVNLQGAIIYITSREMECWELFSRGHSHKRIADMLGLSHKTVDTHLINVKHKLDVHSRDQLSKIFHNSIFSNLRESL